MRIWGPLILISGCAAVADPPGEIATDALGGSAGAESPSAPSMPSGAGGSMGGATMSAGGQPATGGAPGAGGTGGIDPLQSGGSGGQMSLGGSSGIGGSSGSGGSAGAPSLDGCTKTGTAGPFGTCRQVQKWSCLREPAPTQSYVIDGGALTIYGCPAGGEYACPALVEFCNA